MYAFARTEEIEEMQEYLPSKVSGLIDDALPLLPSPSSNCFLATSFETACFLICISTGEGR